MQSLNGSTTRTPGTFMLIERLIALARGIWPSGTWKDHARARGLLPVGDIGWTWLYAVDEEGRLYCSEGDFQEFREEDDPWRRHVMLAEAARLYPEVRNLAPVRARGDRTCDVCGGTGHREGSRRACRCGGTGWLPASVPGQPR